MVVWGVTTRESESTVRAYAETLELDFPILLDSTGDVTNNYNLLFPFPSGAYPRDFVVGTDGRVVYANNEPDVEAIEQAIVDELAD